MLPDRARAAPVAGAWQRLPPVWRRPLALLAMTWCALIALFASDWRDMALQWWDISTYNHALLIPPILVWLVSLRMHEAAKVPPQGWWPGLALFGAAAFLWLLGDFAGLSLATQLGAVLMLQASALALLGPRVCAALLFPLTYMLFMVPAGDELIPLLQTITARMTMVLLGWSQVPAHIEGVFITTPGGYFEVAEACSGVKFLIAMIAYGALVANVCFRSWPRRLAFMAMALVVPILANGVRAWGTIFIAEHHGIAFAEGFDHVFYGWIFFALVMALVMAIGWKFFDRAIDDRMIDADAILATPWLSRLAAFAMNERRVLAGLTALAVAFTAWGGLANRLEAEVPAQVFLPQVPGWTRIDYRPAAPWEPLHTGAAHRLLGRYRDPAGHVVDVSYALYASQGDGREAGGFGQGALPLGGDWAWESGGPAFIGACSDRIQTAGPVHRLAVTFYQTGGLLTGSNARLKLANILDRLLLRKRQTATLILSAEDAIPDAPAAEESLRAFLHAAGPIDAWMDRIGGAG